MVARPQPAPNVVDTRVGTGVALCRIERGLSALSVATSLGITEAELNAREEGRIRFHPDELWKLATLLEIRPGWFFESLCLDHDGAPPEK